MRIYLVTFTLMLTGLSPLGAIAQDEGSDADVEALYDKLDVRETNERRSRKKTRKQSQERSEEFSDLNRLAPFKDIAVIQRRYLPRTGRFDFSGNIMGTMNNPFFNNFALAARLAYNFAEKHAVEGQYHVYSSSDRSVTKGLSERNIETKSLVTAKSYYGLSYKWTPVYGKVTFLNSSIVPFDLHFQLGAGLTQTKEKSGELTYQVGTGQTFALGKASAFRWDFLWHYYSAEGRNEKKNNEVVKTNQSDLIVSVGFSFFFPEATYR